MINVQLIMNLIIYSCNVKENKMNNQNVLKLFVKNVMKKENVKFVNLIILIKMETVLINVMQI